MSIAGPLTGNLDLPLRELGHAVPVPLLRHDEAHGVELVTTLRYRLAHDCAPAATARVLTLHRHSPRYGLRLIEQLTGRDLDRLPTERSCGSPCSRWRPTPPVCSQGSEPARLTATTAGVTGSGAVPADLAFARCSTRPAALRGWGRGTRSSSPSRR